MGYCLKSRKDIILDCLDRCPAFQGVLAHVTTEPALLHSAKWNIRTEHRPCIHRDLTRLNGFRNAVGAVDVVGEKGRTQTVMRVVGFGDDFFLGGELGNALFPSHECYGNGEMFENNTYCNGTEDLLTHHCRIIRDVCKGRVLDKVPLLADLFSSKQQPGTGLLALSNIVQDLLMLSAVHDGPLGGRRIQRIASNCWIVGSSLSIRLDEAIVDGVLDVDPRTRRTNLPIIRGNSDSRPEKRVLEVAIVKDDRRAFAAQLQAHLLQVGS